MHDLFDSIWKGLQNFSDKETLSFDILALESFIQIQSVKYCCSSVWLSERKKKFPSIFPLVFDHFLKKWTCCDGKGNTYKALYNESQLWDDLLTTMASWNATFAYNVDN